MVAQEDVVVALVGRVRDRTFPTIGPSDRAVFEERLDAVLDLAGHGEWGVAFEILCSNVHDVAVALGDADFAAFADAGGSLGVAPARWTFLRELVVD